MGQAMKAKSGVKKPTNLKPRHEPPTLEEALFAAEGLTDERDQQIAFAAELTSLPLEEVAKAAATFFNARKNVVTIESARRPGSTIVVEKRSSPFAIDRKAVVPFSFERKPAAKFVVETRMPRRIITLPRN